MSLHGISSDLAVPSEVEIRTLLSNWARGHWRVRNDSFDGPLGIRDVTTLRIVTTRMLERRNEQEVSTPGPIPDDLPQYSGPLARLSLSYDGWEAAEWLGAREGSDRTLTCNQCKGIGNAICAQCGGRGFRSCPPVERCLACGGFGAVGGLTT